MSLFHQETDNLLGGVSQLDPRQRNPNQVESALNVYPDIVDGLTRRPPTEHQALLDGDQFAWSNGGWSTVISRSLDRRYRVTIVDGNLKVYDTDTHQEVTIDTPNGTGYLTGSDFRVASAGGRTFLVNRAQEVAIDNTKALFEDLRLYPEALIYVRQADYGTTYKIRVEGFEAVYKTPAANNPESREALDTQTLARELHDALVLSTTTTNLFYDEQFTSYFDIELIGSTIFIKRKGALGGFGDFEIETSDGLADKGLLVVKDSVQRYEDLPLQARDGFVCRIEGDPGSDADDQWVVYSKDEGTEQRGVWRETVKPGEPVALDPATMPHELILGGPWTGKGTVRSSPPDVQIIDSRWDVENQDWSDLTDSSGTTALSGGTDVRLSEQDAEVTHTPPSAAIGSETLLEAALDVDTSQVDPGTVTSVYLEIDDGAGTWTTLDRLDVPPGESLRDQRLRGRTTPASGATVRARVAYSTGETPDTYRQANVTMTATMTDPPVSGGGQPPIERRKFTLRYATKNAKYVSFGQSRAYPAGYDIVVTIEVQPPLVGDSFTYTPSATETGREVAEGMAAVIDADPDYQARVAGPGVIEILYDDGSIEPDVSGGVNFYTDRMAWLGDLDLSGLSLVGATVTNESDGSTGTVVSHTNDTVVVDDLTGGRKNTFQRGDQITISGDDTNFVFKQAAWADREVGSLESNPFPEFVGEPIKDLTFFQGRLGFVWDDKLHFSRSGNLTNLMRSTALEFRAGDGFGVQAAGDRMFHSAVEWDEDLYLVADTGITLVRGDPIITPTTVSMQLVARIDSCPGLQPLVLENSLYIGCTREAGGVLWEIRRGDSDTLQTQDRTLTVPEFITGTPLDLVGSYADGVVFFLTTDGLFVYRFEDTDERVMSAFVKWDLGPGDVQSIDIINGQLGLIISRPDSITLETITLDT